MSSAAAQTIRKPMSQSQRRLAEAKANYERVHASYVSLVGQEAADASRAKVIAMPSTRPYHGRSPFLTTAVIDGPRPLPRISVGMEGGGLSVRLIS